MIARDRYGVTLELLTGGFYAEPQEDGSVRLTIPGFESLAEGTGPELPVKRNVAGSNDDSTLRNTSWPPNSGHWMRSRDCNHGFIRICRMTPFKR